jgi:hypothetical protein
MPKMQQHLFILAYGTLCFVFAWTLKPAESRCFSTVDEASLALPVPLLACLVLALGGLAVRRCLAPWQPPLVLLVTAEYDSSAAELEQALLKRIKCAQAVDANGLVLALMHVRHRPVCLVGLSHGAVEAVLGARIRAARVVANLSPCTDLPTAGPLMLVDRHDDAQHTSRLVQDFAASWSATQQHQAVRQASAA